MIFEKANRMSLLAIVYHLVPEAPILVAYNRDETEISAHALNSVGKTPHFGEY